MNRVIYTAATLLLLLSGCNTAQINYNDKNRTFQYRVNDRLIVESRAKKVYENRLRLANINIYQNVYILENGNIVTHEEAYADPTYVFIASIDLLVHRIFDKYHAQFIKRVGNVYFYKLTSSDKTLYMLVQNRNKKKLDFLYGTDKDGFEALVKSVTHSNVKNSFSTVVQNKPSSTLNAVEYIQSSWSYKHSIFSELVKREGGSARLHK